MERNLKRAHLTSKILQSRCSLCLIDDILQINFHDKRNSFSILSGIHETQERYFFKLYFSGRKLLYHTKIVRMAMSNIWLGVGFFSFLMRFSILVARSSLCSTKRGGFFREWLGAFLMSTT